MSEPSRARNYQRLIAPDGRRVDVVDFLVPERLADGYKVDPFPDRRPDISEKLLGKHRGRTAFIAATGPSLSSIRLATIGDIVRKTNAVVWGVNDVWRSHPEGALACDYYVVLDDTYLSSWSKQVLAYLSANPKCLPCFAFQCQLAIDYYELRVAMSRTPDTDPEYIPAHYFHGYSSGVAAAQMAMHAGCDSIILLGHDCRSFGKKTHTFGTRTAEEANRNYQQGRSMLDAYRVLAKHAKQLAIPVYNLSADSAIDCFPKIDPAALADGRIVTISSPV